MTRPYWWRLELSGDTKYVGVSLDQSGLRSATLQLVLRELQYVLQYIVINTIFFYKQPMLVFLLYFSVALAQHNWRHNRHNHGRRR